MCAPLSGSCSSVEPEARARAAAVATPQAEPMLVCVVDHGSSDCEATCLPVSNLRLSLLRWLTDVRPADRFYRRRYLKGTARQRQDRRWQHPRDTEAASGGTH